MRICEPQNQFGQKLVSVADFANVSLRVEKTVDTTGIITITADDISDIELWELSSVAVEIDGQYQSILPESFRNADGSLSIRFFEPLETVDFNKAVVVLKHATVDGVITKITIAMKIAALMAKTLEDSKKPDYDVDANIAEWKALGVEAKTTEPDNYPYADCSTAAELTTAGFNTGATTIGSDVCLISLDTVNNSMIGTRTFPNVRKFEADLPSLKNGKYMFADQPNLQSFSGKIPNLTNASGMFDLCSGLTEWNGTLSDNLTNASSMFRGCSGLTEWNVELPSGLEDASYMFQECTGLTEWTVPLPNSITDTSGMFDYCTRLTKWNVALPSGLEDASFMFSGCKLSKASVQKIADTIPTHTSSPHYITIGVDSTQITQAEQNAFNTTIVNKGWTVTWQRN